MFVLVKVVKELFIYVFYCSKEFFVVLVFQFTLARLLRLGNN